MSEPEEQPPYDAPSTACGGPPPPQKRGRIPRWTISFLRALERTGEVRAAAEDAGIDYSTAYARRRAHADFAEAWDAAMYRYTVAKEQREREEVEALDPFHHPSPTGFGRSTSPANAGEDVVAAAGQMKRAGHGRWSKAKEAMFFEELAATANVKRAAAAAGVSANAVYARRLKHPLFRAKWEAVRETAKASIDMHLLEESKRSFDPEALDTGAVEPRVTIDQAIRIAQGGGSRARRDAESDPFDEPEGADPMDDVRKRLISKINRMHQRAIVEKTAQGWSYDESYDVLIPPGWVMGPEYTPKSPEQDPD